MNLVHHHSTQVSLLVLLVCTLLLPACDSGGSDEPGVGGGGPPLTGSYSLTRMTDITGELSGESNAVLVAGEPYVVTFDDEGQSFTLSIEVSGSLELSSLNRYTFDVTIVSSVNGGTQQTQREIDTGTWSATGSELIIMSESDEEQPVQTLEYTLTSTALSLEDAETRLVFERE